MKNRLARRTVRRIGKRIVRRVAEQAADRIADRAADAVLKHGRRAVGRIAAGKLIRKVI